MKATEGEGPEVLLSQISMLDLFFEVFNTFPFNFFCFFALDQFVQLLDLTNGFSDSLLQVSAIIKEIDSCHFSLQDQIQNWSLVGAVRCL